MIDRRGSCSDPNSNSQPVPDILCPTDFTPAAEKGMLFAMRIAAKEGSSITRLHVLEKHDEQHDAFSSTRLFESDGAATTLASVKVREVLREGDPLEQIIAESRKGHALMVAGTHGPKGFRQSLLGSDILKLVRHVAVPSLVVQEGSHVNADLNSILLPVAAHDDISHLLDAVCDLAKAYDAEVLVFRILRPGEDASEKLLDNKRKMLHLLTAAGIRHAEVNVASNVFSIGFAEQTIRYAKEINAGCIAMMAKASDEYRYMADAEKERMLMNEECVPVLCGV